MKNIVIKHLTPYSLPEFYLHREETWSRSSGSFYQTARLHVPEESILQSRCHANLTCKDRHLAHQLMHIHNIVYIKTFKIARCNDTDGWCRFSSIRLM